MTIVTKPLSDKKQDQLKKPLVEAGELPQEEHTVVVPFSTGDPIYVVPGRHSHSPHTVVCLFLVALAVVGVGALGGLYFYRRIGHMGHVQTQRIKAFIPIGESAKLYMPGVDDEMKEEVDLMPDSNIDKFNVHDMNAQADRLLQKFRDELRLNKKGITEEFELDETSGYEKISVPDFGIGREGRFIHDFHANKTGIVDINGGRCFVMPLNRDQVLPPRSIVDLLSKIWNGYYEVDTEVIRENYRVELPPVENLEELGRFIYRECVGLPTYRLRPVTDHVFKRGLSESQVFQEFAGKKMTQFRIFTDGMNEYEKDLAKNKV